MRFGFNISSRIQASLLYGVRKDGYGDVANHTDTLYYCRSNIGSSDAHATHSPLKPSCRCEPPSYALAKKAGAERLSKKGLAKALAAVFQSLGGSEIGG